jgi:hypothetical protein
MSDGWRDGTWLRMEGGIAWNDQESKLPVVRSIAWLDAVTVGHR